MYGYLQQLQGGTWVTIETMAIYEGEFYGDYGLPGNNFNFEYQPTPAYGWRVTIVMGIY
jgi:hypothetical protein